ncbi:MAG: hypothetical protein ABSF58_05305 [Solirubrobacteraceae bacterium]
MASVATEAFGLPLELPPGLLAHALRPAKAGELRAPTVVTVAADPIGEWDPGIVERVREVRHEDRIVWSVDADPGRGFRMESAGHVTMVVSEDGLSIRCAPAGGGSDSGWPALVTAQALPLAATLRGLEVFHASAVSLDGRALLFCASRGGGKSSLAAQLVLRGAGLLSDDAVAIDEQLVAHPSTGALHLRPAELARLGQAARDELQIGSLTRLDGRTVGSVPPAGAAPLDCVCLLERSAADGPAMELLEAVDPVLLLGSTFNLSVRSPDRLLRHLEFCARIAAQVRVFRLLVRPGVDAVALADEVLQCL